MKDAWHLRLVTAAIAALVALAAPACDDDKGEKPKPEAAAEAEARPAEVAPAGPVQVAEVYVTSEPGVALVAGAPEPEAVRERLLAAVGEAEHLSRDRQPVAVAGQLAYTVRVLEAGQDERLVAVALSGVFEPREADDDAGFGAEVEVLARDRVTIAEGADAGGGDAGGAAALEAAIERLVDEAVADFVGELDTLAEVHTAAPAELGAVVERDGVAEAARLQAIHRIRDAGAREAVPALTRALGADDPDVVAAAAAALQALEAKQAVADVIEAAGRLGRERHYPQVIQLLYVLGDFGGERARAYIDATAEGHQVPAVRQVAQEVRQKLDQTGAQP